MTIETVLKRNKNCKWVNIYEQQKLSTGTIKALIGACPIYKLTGNEYYYYMNVIAYGYDPINDLLEIWVRR